MNDLFSFSECGVRRVVCLAEDFQPCTYEGITVHPIHVEEFEPPSIQQINEFMDVCEAAKQRREVVYQTSIYFPIISVHNKLISLNYIIISFSGSLRALSLGPRSDWSDARVLPR